jgi:hypothetical protein
LVRLLSDINFHFRDVLLMAQLSGLKKARYRHSAFAKAASALEALKPQPISLDDGKSEVQRERRTSLGATTRDRSPSPRIPRRNHTGVSLDRSYSPKLTRGMTPAFSRSMKTAPEMDVTADVLKQQLDAAIDLYQTELRLRMDAEDRIARLESIVTKQAAELEALRGRRSLDDVMIVPKPVSDRSSIPSLPLPMPPPPPVYSRDVTVSAPSPHRIKPLHSRH